MLLNPLKITKEVSETYKRYLTTVFRLRDPILRHLFFQEVEKFGFINGPLLEATPPFEQGCFLKDLIHKNILEKELECFIYDSLPELNENPLYSHQEKAIKKIMNGRNVVIASGTGSGKTECFLIPVYNYLLKQYQEGSLGPGVRTLLLYPMNALANDQLRRLRKISKVLEEKMPDVKITFGRYVGDTPKTRREGEEKFRLAHPGEVPPKNELLSREEMQKSPPHILITNYAMLEYLLLRPDDSPFFDGDYAKHWKFLVLDEAHIYNGAAGIEMGMLIRRLKDRICEGEGGILRCIATSATLAKEESDFEKAAKFATNLFGEKFEWNSSNNEYQDIIKGERIKLLTLREGLTLPLKLYPEIDEIVTSVNLSSEIIEKCFGLFQKAGVDDSLLARAKIQSNGDAKKFLYEILQKDQKIIELKKLLEVGSANFEDCVKKIAGNNKPSDIEKQAVISLVNVAVWSRPEQDLPPILPARYHLFIRAPEGIFVSFSPETRISLERQELTPEGAPVFELASCRRCGQAYLVGNIMDGKLKHTLAEVEEPKQNRYFLLTDKKHLFEEDEDEEIAEPEEISDKGKEWKLCVKCGAIWEEYEKPSCQCTDNARIRVLTEVIPKEGILNKCYLCGLRSRNIVREFVFQQDAPAAVLTTALFQTLKEKEPKKRKILAFSDSRQDAAFFAPYLDSTYKKILYRRLIVEALQRNKQIKDYRLQSLCEDVLKLAEENSLLDPAMDEKQRKQMVWGWILEEFCALAWERNICLEGVGLVSYLPILSENWNPINELMSSPWNLSTEEAVALYQALLNTIRLKMAITFPTEGPSPKDEIFAPRNRTYRFSGWKSNSKKGIYSWNPTTGRANTRLEFLYKLFEKITGREDDKEECKKILARIWDDLSAHWVGENKEICQLKDSREGVLFQLNYKYWRILQALPDSQWFICNKCGLFSLINIKGVCPTFGCEGSLELLGSSPKQLDIKKNHYRYLYSHLAPIKMSTHEHTAQLTPRYASDIQQGFINGEINVLSCSTTFELGVDLGELETIFMRNVPPEPANYIQRSGRAGRRRDSAGFTLTFCQRRSHDLTYFKEPEKMVDGRIRPPAVEILNEKIVHRHLHSMVFADFFRRYPEYFRHVDNFFRLKDDNRKEPSGPEMLKIYLDTKPKDLLTSLKRTIPAEFHKTFDIENWGWLKELFDLKEGVLELANAQINSDYSRLKKFYSEREQEWIASSQDQYKRDGLNIEMKWAANRMKTIREKYLLDFLASHTVIPKYGFPVDVVGLDILHHARAAEGIQLERDLRIAISEFAPGSHVVANGYVWKSTGLKLVKDKAWDIFGYAICPHCKKFHIESGTIEDKSPFSNCQSCGKAIPYNDKHMRFIGKFIVPIFGFETSKECEPEVPGESRPRKEFATRPYFFDHDKLEERSFPIGKMIVKGQYSPNGSLAVICKGKKGAGFHVCFNCGFATSERRETKNTHNNSFGGKCSSPLKGPFDLGHTFKTDILLISFEEPKFKEVFREDFWFSLLYALLESASQTLQIRRLDLDGCLYPFGGKVALVLFDNVPGGAGHVKRIMEGQNLYEVFRIAKERMEKCTCGEETSCYGCLRNYQNQFCHDHLKRGIVKDFLSKNLD